MCGHAKGKEGPKTKPPVKPVVLSNRIRAMFLTAPSLPPPKLHGVGPQHLLAGNGRRGLGRQGLPGILDLWRGGKGRQGLPVLAAALGIPGGKGPLEVHVAEGPRGGDGLRRDKAGLPLLGVEAAVVVLLCRAASHRSGLGVGEGEEGGLEGGGCPLLPGGEGMGRRGRERAAKTWRCFKVIWVFCTCT